MIIKFNMAANMSIESELIGFFYPDHSKVLCDGIMDLYKSKACTDLSLKVNGGCETLVHTFMLNIFAPKLFSHCQDIGCDLQGFDVDQDTISTLLDFIYSGQVMVNRHKLDIIRRGADQLGFNVLSQQIGDFTEEDIIDSSSSENESEVEFETEQIIHSINSKKPPMIDKDAILRCSRCDFKVEILDGFREVSIDEFKDHLAKVHRVTFDEDSVKISYKCRDCGFEGEDRKAIEKHQRIRHPKKAVKTFECFNCDFVTDTKSILNRHLKIEHPSDKSLWCPECDFHTPSSRKLKAHQSMEHNPGEYECDECARKFETFAGKQSHYKMVHLESEDRNACYLCSFKGKMRTDLKQHLVDEHNFRQTGFEWPEIYKVYDEKKQCPHCEAVLKNQTLLIDHLADKHKVDLEGNPVEPKYKCKLCDLVAYSRRQLHRHNLKTHSKIEFRCDYCDFKCRRRLILAGHIGRKHPGEKLYLCEVCGQSFGTRKSLTKHQNVHVEAHFMKWKRFKCEVCGERFPRKQILKEHVLKVHGENAGRYERVLCPYVANIKETLDEHVKTMHKDATLQVLEDSEDIWECEKCPYAAKTKEHLANHVKTKHKTMTLQVVEDREDIRECEIVIVKVESCELAAEHAESL